MYLIDSITAKQRCKFRSPEGWSSIALRVI